MNIKDVRKSFSTPKGKRALAEAGAAFTANFAATGLNALFKRGGKHWSKSEGYDAFAKCASILLRSSVLAAVTVAAERRFPRRKP